MASSTSEPRGVAAGLTFVGEVRHKPARDTSTERLSDDGDLVRAATVVRHDPLPGRTGIDGESLLRGCAS